MFISLLGTNIFFCIFFSSIYFAIFFSFIIFINNFFWSVSLLLKIRPLFLPLTCITKAISSSTVSFESNFGQLIFPFLLSPDQECFCMTSFLAFTSLGSRVYFSGGTVLRYWYVKSSLKPEVTVGVQSRKTLYTCLGIPQLLILLHLLDGLIVYNTKENAISLAFMTFFIKPDQKQLNIINHMIK